MKYMLYAGCLILNCVSNVNIPDFRGEHTINKYRK